MFDERKIDLHMHSTVSDGTDTPLEILSKVKEAGIPLFALTDHDAIKGSCMIREALTEGDPLLLTGTEFSCKDELGKYHILGYCFDPKSAPILALMDKGRGLRRNKLVARLEFIKQKFGFSFPQEEIRKLFSLDNPGKPHIGNLMVKYGYARSRDEAIEKFIDLAKLKYQHLRPEEAIDAILKGGGLPILAHPSLGSGKQMITGAEMEERLKRLMGYGLQGVEAFYSKFTPQLQAENLALAEKYGLYVTAGSDYHGTNKKNFLGETHLESVSEIPEGMRHFLEKVEAAVGTR